MSKSYPLDFTVTDYQGSTTSLSSYNLSISPLTFIATGASIIDSRTKLIWDFGDGTRLEQTSPTYYYKAAGYYTVKLIFYDCVNQGVISSITKNIQVLDYINDTFSISVSGNTLTAYSGGLTPPITISQSFPVDTISSTIRYSISGSNSTNYFFLDKSKYDHLKPYNALLTLTYNKSLANYEIKEVDNININYSPIYVTLSGNSIVNTVNSSTSIIAGYSGTNTFYYRDDLPCSLFKLSFNRVVQDVSNTLNTTLTGFITQSQPFSSASGTLSGGMSITSNGVDGDNVPNNIFDIGGIKLVNTFIPFVIKLKGYDNQITIKNSRPLGLSSIGYNNLNVVVYKVDSSSSSTPLSSTHYTIGSLQNTISTYNLSGCFRGYVKFTGITEPTQCMLYATCSGARIPQTSGQELSADKLISVSNVFTVYPEDYYTLYRKNENFDAEGMFKSIGVQEPLLNKDIFFEKFLGTIFGSQSPDSDAVGKKVYERIANFVDNTTNIDTAEIFQLISIGEMMDAKPTVFNSALVNYPDKIRRIASLLSINKHNLFGYRNQFAQNFNTKGFADQDIFGVNLGSVISFDTDIVPVNTPYIVAYEKFSRQYTRLNAFQPVTEELPSFDLLLENGQELFTESGDILLGLILPAIQYKLRDYTSGWGWPLILPDNSTSSSLSTYYTFYNYVETPANNSVGGIIDFSTSSLSVSASQESLTEDNGIFEQIILNTLYQSLALTKYD